MKLLILLLLAACCINTANAQPGTPTSNDPLVVIDSIIVGRGLTNISIEPGEMKEFSILEGSKSGKIYGPAGKSGAIFIKTKQPSKYRFLSLKELLREYQLSLTATAILVINDKPLKDTSFLKLDANNIKSVIQYDNGFNNLSAPHNVLKVTHIFTKGYNPIKPEPLKKPGTIMIRGEKPGKG